MDTIQTDVTYTPDTKEFILLKLLKYQDTMSYMHTKKFIKHYNKFYINFCKILPISQNDRYDYLATLCAILNRYIKLDISEVLIEFIDNNLLDYLFTHFHQIGRLNAIINDPTIKSVHVMVSSSGKCEVATLH